MPACAGGDLGRLLLRQVAHGLDVRVAGERRVVDHHLRVERQHPAVTGHGQRVDLGQLGVRVEEGGDETLEEGGEGGPMDAGDGQEGGDRRDVVRSQPRQRVQPMTEDRVGIGVRDLLDLDPALRAGDDGDRLRRPIEDDGEVVLVPDVHRRGDEHRPHPSAGDLEGEDLRRSRLGLIRGGGQLHAAGLAPAAGQDLGLDHDRDGKPLGGSPGVRRGGRHFAGEGRDPVAGEDLLAAELLELHARERTRPAAVATGHRLRLGLPTLGP